MEGIVPFDQDDRPPVWSKLDANVAAIYRDYLHEREHGVPPEVRFHRDVAVDGRIHVSLAYAGDLAPIEALGFETISRMRRGGSASGFVDLANLERLAAHPDVLRFSFSSPPERMIVKSVPDIGADKLRTLVRGTFEGITGENVIIGILDTGIDFRSKVFDRTGSSPRQTRILRIWDHTLEAKEKPEDPGEEGPPPAMLGDTEEAVTSSYGVEYTNTDIDKVLQEVPGAMDVRHRDPYRHGTFIAAIAASDGGEDGKSVGVAPRANLIVVNLLEDRIKGDWFVHFRHAVNYIINTAEELARVDGVPHPVVINGSFGYRLSAHDGRSPEERFLDFRFGGARGRVYVAAAGNDGGTCRHPSELLKDGRPTLRDARNQHAQITFKKDEEVKLSVELRDVRTLKLGRLKEEPRRQVLVRIFYPVGSQLKCSVILPDRPVKINGPELDRDPTLSKFWETWRWGLWNESFEKKGAAPARCNVVTFTSWPNTYGQYLDGTYDFYLTLNADDKAHVYCSDVDEGGFRIQGPTPPGVDLTERFLIGSPAGSPSVITVASYDHTKSDRPHAPFSSRGPIVSWDATPPIPKPDIAAPGIHIVTVTTDETFGDEGAEGTSTSAPHVAGTIALMFQKNPYLSGDEIKEILALSAQNPTPPVKEEMGAGRLNAFDAVTRVKP